MSAADAVIVYARNFIPAWAGAISIDLLPAVLVFIIMVIQAAIRAGRGIHHSDDRMTVGELRAALAAAEVLREYEAAPAAPAPAVASVIRRDPQPAFRANTAVEPATASPDDPRRASGVPEPMER